jgi:3-demethoxyubiquinol 3-hydroxylase
MNAEPAPSPAPLTVYFDGACPVCSREIAAYRRQPGADACEWVDASACAESALGADLTRDAALARFHVRRADGSLVDGMRGFATLWQALPRTAWLGRIAAFGPMPRLLDAAYGVFLSVRRVWRPAVPASAWPAELTADLRSDHAGEVGAVMIYRGVLAVARDPALRAFATHHLETERGHLAVIETHLPAAHRSRLLPAWRIAGWLTGALPALFGPPAVYATIPADTARTALRAELDRCREDELRHRDDALRSGPAGGMLVRAWTAMVGAGSAGAVALARRL